MAVSSNLLPTPLYGASTPYTAIVAAIGLEQMGQELVKKNIRICMAWIGHNRLEPEIPCNSLAIIEPSHNFVIDGVYALNIDGALELYRCSGHERIAISHNDPHSLAALTRKEFGSVVKGRVIGHLKIEA